MITYELDPDVVRWGLHLLDVCSLSDAGSHGSITQYETNLGQVECVQEGYCDTDHINVENDEIIAHALQEEYSSLAAAEVCEVSHSSEDHSQESVLAQDWRGPPSMHCDLGPKTDQREAHPASYFHPGEESPDVVDWPSLPEITDDSALDGEVGKRLNKMVSIPHVPKINGEIPSIDEATSDHQRLIDRLQLYGLDELKVQGDGNCQFRALSDQFYRTPDHHKFVRQQVTSQLKSHPDKYDNYVPMGYSDYLKKMSKVGEWGDHVTLQAAADSYGVRIFVLTSFKDTCYIEILPQIEKSKRVICLSFWAEVHYNSIYPEGELPVPETKKKKKWWLFGS